MASASASATAHPAPVVLVCLSIVIMPKARFSHGSAVLDEEGKRLFDEVVKVLRDYPQVRVELGGHANVSELSQSKAIGLRRATAARSYLVGRGVDPARLCIKDYGASRPLASPHTPAGRANNRRVELRKMEKGEPCAP